MPKQGLGVSSLRDIQGVGILVFINPDEGGRVWSNQQNWEFFLYKAGGFECYKDLFTLNFVSDI